MNKAYEKGRQANRFARLARERAANDLHDEHLKLYVFRGIRCSNPRCTICKG